MPTKSNKRLNIVQTDSPNVQKRLVINFQQAKMVYQRIRPDNFCLECRYTWIPRGQMCSSQCPSCASLLLISSYDIQPSYYPIWGCWLLIILVCAYLAVLRGMWVGVLVCGVIVYFCVGCLKDQKLLEEKQRVQEVYRQLKTKGWDGRTLFWPSKTPNFIQAAKYFSEQMPRKAFKAENLAQTASNVPQRVPSFDNQTRPLPPVKRKAIPAPVKAAVWRRAYGNRMEGYCLLCHNTVITTFQFHCGHIIALARGGQNHLDNLIPICATCNNSMGTKDVFTFQAELQKFGFK